MKQTRFVGRKEYFGSLVYDRHEHKYLYLDRNSTSVLNKLSTDAPDMVYSELGGNFTRRQFNEFLEFAKSQSLLNTEYRFDGQILDSNFVDNQLSAPEQIYFGITYECPGRCIHCYTDSGHERPNELNSTEIQRFVDEVTSLGVYRMSVDGGEPLCRDDIFNVIAYMKDHGMDVSMTTNAWLVNERNAQMLNELDLKTLTVSFDGGTKETFEYIRGRGSFERTIEGAKLLRKHSQGRLALRLTLMEPNKKEIPQLISIAETLGFDAVKINPVRLFGRAKNQRKLEIKRHDFIETVQNGLRLREKTNVELVLPSFPYITVPRTYINLGNPEEDIDLGFGCVGGLTTSYINAEGDITPCCFLGEEFVSGNLRKNSFKEVWDSGEGFKKKRDIRGDSSCDDCGGYENCEGGCRARALYEFGDINAPDPYCIYLEEDKLHGHERTSGDS